MTGGVNGETRWDEIVQFSEMPLWELIFWAHNTVKMVTRCNPMILPRFEDLEIEWARLETEKLPSPKVSPFRCEAGWLQMEGQMAGVPPFVFGSRNGHIWVLSQLSLYTHNSDCSFDNVFSISIQFFPRMAPQFLVILIHQVIRVPVPSTPVSYRYTNSIELVPRFGLWSSPRHPLVCPWSSHQVQPIPWKMRLEMIIGTQKEILIGIMKLLF